MVHTFTQEYLKFNLLYGREVLHCKNHIFLMHSSGDAHLGCFQDLTLTNRVAINTGVDVSLWNDIFILLRRYSTEGQLGQMEMLTSFLISTMDISEGMRIILPIIIFSHNT